MSASERFVARETVYLATEIRRIFAVSGICLLLLAALVVVDRVS